MKKRSPTILLALGFALFSSACASPRDDRFALGESTAGSARIVGFRENVVIDELKHDLPFVGVSIGRNTKRVRTGIRVAGSGNVSGYFQLFRENLNSDLLPVEFGLYGLGIGLATDEVLLGWDDSFALVMPIKLGANAAIGDEDFLFDREELRYFEAEFESGLGLRVYGLQASLGFNVAVLSGLNISSDSDIESVERASAPQGLSHRFEGTNVGGFAELSFARPSPPFYAKCRALIGDVEGVSFTLGIAY